MNLKNAALSLLDLFRLNKGWKIAEEPAVLLAPLIQRLNLPEISEKLKHRAFFVHCQIRLRFPNGKISKRVLGKICRHYGVNLRGYGFFRAIPKRPNMLAIVQPS